MPPPLVIVGHLSVDEPPDFLQRLRLWQQHPVLHLEPPPKRLHPGIISTTVLCIGQTRSFLQKHPPKPGVAGVDRVLVVVDDHAGKIPAQRRYRGVQMVQGLQRQAAVTARTDGPAARPATPAVTLRRIPKLEPSVI